MDIEDYYDGDARRRGAQELSFGLSWRNASDAHRSSDLFWNAGTGELYLMHKPHPNPLLGWVGYSLEDIGEEVASVEHRIVGALDHLIHPGQIRAKTGKVSPRHRDDVLTEDLAVEILGVIPDEERVLQLLDGWEHHVEEPDGLSWLRARVAGALQ